MCVALWPSHRVILYSCMRRLMDERRWYLQSLLEETRSRDNSLSVQVERLRVRLLQQKRKYKDKIKQISHEHHQCVTLNAELAEQLKAQQSKIARLEGDKVSLERRIEAHIRGCRYLFSCDYVFHYLLLAAW